MVFWAANANAMPPMPSPATMGVISMPRLFRTRNKPAVNQTQTSSQLLSSTAAILPGCPTCRSCWVFNPATSLVNRTSSQPAA